MGRAKTWFYAALFLLAVTGPPARAQDRDSTEPFTQPPPVPTLPQQEATSTKIIPLPIYSTLPQQGSTFGFMPVFLVVEKNSQRTRSIIAPSLSWNPIIRFTHTFRIYHYPSENVTINIIPSFSTNVNRGLTFDYFNMPKNAGRWTLESTSHIKRSIFYRFFGLGAQTHERDEASYTRISADTQLRYGYNFTRYFNVGPVISFERHIIEQKGVNFLPLATEKFRGTTGFNGATTLFEGLSVRYDTRPQSQYSEEGFATDLTGGVFQGLAGANTMSRVTWESRLLWRELSFLSGGARAFWGYTGGSNIPFYYQSNLGGSNRLRGFTEDRFIDKGAWEVELEQRIRLFSTNIYGVITDWRIDPFVAVGQVYNGLGDIVSRPRITGGLGFRAFVRPNVLGRVDTAIGGEGIKVYVELGYPF